MEKLLFPHLSQTPPRIRAKAIFKAIYVFDLSDGAPILYLIPDLALFEQVLLQFFLSLFGGDQNSFPHTGQDLDGPLWPIPTHCLEQKTPLPSSWDGLL